MNNFSRSNDWDDESLFDNYAENDPYEDDSYYDDESFSGGGDDDDASEAWRWRKVWNNKTRRYEWRRQWYSTPRIPAFRPHYGRMFSPLRPIIPIRPMRPVAPRPYQGAATLDTPAGQAQVELPANLVHKGEYQHLQKQVKADNQALIAAGNELGMQSEQLQAMEQALAAFMDKTNKKFDTLRQSSLISGLIQPSLTEIKDDKGNVTKVKSASFDLTSSLLPALLAGGFGEGSGSSGNDMLLPLILLSGGLGDSDDKSDNDNMPLVLALALAGGNNM